MDIWIWFDNHRKQNISRVEIHSYSKVNIDSILANRKLAHFMCHSEEMEARLVDFEDDKNEIH